jgi:hypothetical protein
MVLRTVVFVLVLVSLTSLDAKKLLEDDPAIGRMYKSVKLNPNQDFSYAADEIRDIVQTYFPSSYPALDAFNEPDIREQIRKNVITICDKWISLNASNVPTPDPTRINDVIAIRKLYADDAVFNTRQIPKYYHTTLKMQYFKGIIEEKHILATNASYPGAWTANGFWYASSGQYPTFAFSSNLEEPLSEISPGSHYAMPKDRPNFYALGRIHTIPLWKSSTNLVAWAVAPEDYSAALDFIRTLDNETQAFFINKGMSMSQMLLERLFVTLAQVYSADRANGLFFDGLFIDYPKPAIVNRTRSYGEVLYCFDVNRFKYSVFLGLEKDRIRYMSIDAANRTTVVYTSKIATDKCRSIYKYLPDVAINNGMEIVQLIADANLLSAPQTYWKFNEKLTTTMKSDCNACSKASYFDL